MKSKFQYASYPHRHKKSLAQYVIELLSPWNRHYYYATETAETANFPAASENSPASFPETGQVRAQKPRPRHVRLQKINSNRRNLQSNHRHMIWDSVVWQHETSTLARAFESSLRATVAFGESFGTEQLKGYAVKLVITKNNGVGSRRGLRSSVGNWPVLPRCVIAILACCEGVFGTFGKWTALRTIYSGVLKHPVLMWP